METNETQATLRDGQSPPAGDWRIWLCMGGRGAGKDHAGYAWIRAEVEAGAKSLAIIVPRPEDVEGTVLGLLAMYLQHAAPFFSPTASAILFATGAIAQVYTSEDPEAFRDTEHECVWVKDMGLWDAYALNLLAMGQLFRWSEKGRVLVTTVPRGNIGLRELMADPRVGTTRLAPAPWSDALGVPGAAAA